MQEVTRIITARVIIKQIVPEHHNVTEYGKQDVAQAFKEKYGFNDVEIIDVEDVVKDLEDE